MKELRLYIDCENTKCGECRFLYSDIVYKNNKYCRLFEKFIGDCNTQEILRCVKCLEMDVENKSQSKGDNE